jgi:hypothetical protein
MAFSPSWTASLSSVWMVAITRFVVGRLRELEVAGEDRAGSERLSAELAERGLQVGASSGRR